MAPRCLYWRLLALRTSASLSLLPPFLLALPSCLFGTWLFWPLDWSRTVSASLLLVYISLVCPLPLFIPHLSFADLCCRRDHFSSDLFCLFSVLVFLCTLVGGASSFFRFFGPCSFAPPVCFGSVFLGCFFSPPSPWPLLALRSPRVLCLVFLAVDWSRISSTAPHLPPPPWLLRCSPTAPLPFRYSLV